jgi:hypothetical protein
MSLKRKIEGIGPYPSLLLLGLPAAIVEPLKLAAVALAGKGHWITGTTMIAACYAFSLLVVERLFVIVKPKLLTIPWFATIWEAFVSVRTRVSDILGRWIGLHRNRSIPGWLPGLSAQTEPPSQPLTGGRPSDESQVDAAEAFAADACDPDGRAVRRSRLGFEDKYDGFRIVSEIRDARVALYSRKGKIISHSYIEVAKALEGVKGDGVIDGELVAIRKDGVSHLQSPQRCSCRPPVEDNFSTFDIRQHNLRGGQDRYGSKKPSRSKNPSDARICRPIP